MNAFIIPTDDLFLLGILASNVVWQYLKYVCAALGDASSGGRLLLKAEFMKEVPIPAAASRDRAAITQMVKDCLVCEGDKLTNIEKQLDQAVKSLYGLRKSE
jgi:hypothetical protein